MWIDNFGRERIESPFGELVLCQNTATGELAFRKVSRLEKLSTPPGPSRTQYYQDEATGKNDLWTVPTKMAAAKTVPTGVIKMRGLGAPVSIVGNAR